MQEQQKYEELWSRYPEYRNTSQGETIADHFLAVAKPMAHQTVYDFGCGTGRGAARIARRCKVVAFDFAESCLDEEVKGQFEFVQHDLTQPTGRPVADFGFCTDVMEHIPPEDVPKVLGTVVFGARRVYFVIDLVDDMMGKLIGQKLHLTVKPMSWWMEQLKSIGFEILFSQQIETKAIIYGTAWATFGDFEHSTVLNVENEQIASNIKKNLTLGLQEVAPFDEQDTEIILLCGGPSLNDFEEEIIYRNTVENTPVVTVNGSYNWLIERGGRPGAQVIVDAREFNRRFTEPTVLNCKYLISSQCDHDLVKSLPKAQTWLWHGAGAEVEKIIQDAAKESGVDREWFPVPGGTTVTLRAIPLLGMLGFRKIHVYGFDSCLRKNEHHAYEQKENDNNGVIPISVAGKLFHCHGWMVKQAHEFQEVMRHILVPAGIQLAVHGDGMIAAILEAAAAAEEI